MSSNPTFFTAMLQLNNAVLMPQLHLGVYEARSRTKDAVKWALEAGYRAIDSAEAYGNEKDVGSAILAFIASHPSIRREDIWFTTKLRVNVSYDVTRRAIKGSIKRTKLGYVDLYLLHTPSGGKETRLECWRALEDALSEGEVKSIGVSNYGVKHVSAQTLIMLYRLNRLFQLQEILDSKSRVIPAVNQIEVHPFNTHAEIISFCKENGITVQAYSPLVQGRRMQHPTIVELSQKLGVSEAQLLVRWSIQKGYAPLPKSTNRERIICNGNVEGFQIEVNDMSILDSLDEGLVTEWDLLNTD